MAGHVISILSGILAIIISVLLKLIFDRLGVIEAKLNNMVTDATCKERTGICQATRREKSKELMDEDEELWAALNKHSHTGLPADAQVVRR